MGEGNDGSSVAQERDIRDATEKEDNILEMLYSVWRTVPLSLVYVTPRENIPVNKFEAIKKKLLNPGLIHL